MEAYLASTKGSGTVVLGVIMSTKSLYGCGTRGGKDKIDFLVKEMKIKSWEIEIIDFLLGASLTDEVLKIKPAQKLAGQHS